MNTTTTEQVVVQQQHEWGADPFLAGVTNAMQLVFHLLNIVYWIRIMWGRGGGGRGGNVAAALPPAVPRDPNEILPAPFPASEEPIASAWVTRKGTAIPPAFWNNDDSASGLKRLLWTANAKRNPMCRNSANLALAGPPINNLLVSTPEGVFYIGWSAVHDGFRYYSDKSGVRRVYLEMAALQYARTFPTVLPDPDNPMPDPNITPKKKFIAGLMAAGAPPSEYAGPDDETTRRILARRREKDAQQEMVLRATGISAARSIDHVRLQQSIQMRADADPSRLVIDDNLGIVAHNWCPQLRNLWLQRSLGPISFQHAGKIECIFHVHNNNTTRCGVKAKAVAFAAPLTTTTAMAGPIMSVDVCASSSSSAHSAVQRSGFGVKYANTAGKAAAAVNLIAERGMTYKDFIAARAAKVNDSFDKLRQIIEKVESLQSST